MMLKRRNFNRSNGKEGTEDLLHILGLSKSYCQVPLDIVFIALDIEGLWKSRTSTVIYEVGVSILDTRRLLSYDVQNLIETKHYVVGGGNKRYQKSANKFLYGTTQRVDGESLRDLILSFFYWKDELDSTRPSKFRKVVLVCHASYSELGFIRNLGIDITTVTPLIALLDTLKISEYILGRGFALEGLLQTLGFPTRNFHTAGNDANFTLRALVLLALRSQKGITNLSNDQAKILEMLQGIAQQPLPDASERLANIRKSNQHERECQDWANSIEMMDIGDRPLFDISTSRSFTS